MFLSSLGRPVAVTLPPPGRQRSHRLHPSPAIPGRAACSNSLAASPGGRSQPPPPLLTVCLAAQQKHQGGLDYQVGSLRRHVPGSSQLERHHSLWLGPRPLVGRIGHVTRALSRSGGSSGELPRGGQGTKAVSNPQSSPKGNGKPSDGNSSRGGKPKGRQRSNGKKGTPSPSHAAGGGRQAESPSSANGSPSGARRRQEGGKGRMQGGGEAARQGSANGGSSGGNSRGRRHRGRKGQQQARKQRGNNSRGSSGSNDRSGGRTVAAEAKPGDSVVNEKQRWASSLTQFRQESQGLIGRYRSPKKEGQAPINQFGFAKGFLDKYTVDSVLGRGTFGVVSVCVDNETGERCAVKRMQKKYVGGALEGLFALRVQNEVDILGHLGRSLNVAYLHEAYEDEDNVYLVMQLCEGGELWQITQSGRYTDRAAARAIRQILQVVAQCAAKGVLFRDVKPENFLFLDKSPDSVIKAIDFGLAEYCKEDELLKERAGTPVYIAPEVLKMSYGLKADVWSAGVLAYQLLTGRLPFYGEEGLAVSERYMETKTFNNKDVFRAVLYADLDFSGPPWDEISPGARDLMMNMLQRDPSKRLSAAEALEHPWLQEDSDNDGDAVPFSDSIVQRLQRFGTYGRLKQTVLRTVVSSIASDNELVAGLQELFSELDWCRSGRVFYADLRAALQSDRFNLSQTELRQLTSQMEIDNSGYIDYSTWMAAMLDWRKLQGSEEWNAWVDAAFEEFQKEGKIGKEELRKMLAVEDGAELSDIAAGALRAADINRDDYITLEDFRKYMTFNERDRLSLFDQRLSPREMEAN